MTTHNARIYHCTTCGRIVHAELDAEAPQCCGQAMTNACAETIHECDAGEVTAQSQPEAAPPAVESRTNVR